MSEFGKGFTYNLFLFAKHWWKVHEDLEKWKEMREKNPDLFSEKDAISLWFNGAGDHFYGLEVPPKWKNHRIGKLALKLRNKALKWRMKELGDKKDFDKFFADCEKLMRMIDKELGVKPSKADWN